MPTHQHQSHREALRERTRQANRRMTGDVKGDGIAGDVTNTRHKLLQVKLRIVEMRFHRGGRHGQHIHLTQDIVVLGTETRAELLGLRVEPTVIV